VLAARDFPIDVAENRGRVALHAELSDGKDGRT
jgi:hypothetical protein